MARINRDELFIRIALLFSKRSTCKRGQVGVVAIKDSRIIATGYNGSPSGLPHCSDESCTLTEGCVNSIHAEANLIAFASRAGISLEGTTLYCTHAPCRKCAQLIVQAGVKGIKYLFPYRDTSGIDLLWEVNPKISVIRLSLDKLVI